MASDLKIKIKKGRKFSQWNILLLNMIINQWNISYDLLSVYYNISKTKTSTYSVNKNKHEQLYKIL